MRTTLIAILLTVLSTVAWSADVLTADEARKAALAGELTVVDIRTHEEWAQTGLPESRAPFVAVFLACAALGVTAYVKGTSLVGGIPPALAIVIGLFLPFTVAISPQVLDQNKVIQVGDTIPHFTALNDSRETFDSASLHGHLVLIKFFRAHW